MPTIMFCLSSVVIVFTMTADIVDHGRLTSDEDPSGLYVSVMLFMTRARCARTREELAERRDG